MIKLHIGCGKDYLDGYENIDWNPNVKADVHLDVVKAGLPFDDNCVDEVYMRQFLEHIPREKYFEFIDEVYRVCKDGAIIKVHVPHFTGLGAPHPCHYNYYAVNHFKVMEVDLHNDDRYTKARFDVKKVKLLLFETKSKIRVTHWFNFLFNWIFNLGGMKYQMLWEKLNFVGFEEIQYILQIKK